MREYLYDYVENYIQNEIDYIKRENDVCGFDKGRFGDLLSLEVLNQSTQEKNKIVDKIMADNDLEQTLNEVVHYYLYHKERGEN